MPTVWPPRGVTEAVTTFFGFWVVNDVFWRISRPAASVPTASTV